MDENFTIVKQPEKIDYQIMRSHMKKVSAKIRVENFNSGYFDFINIKSLMSGSSVNIDATSDIRRTATLVFKGGGSGAVEKIDKARAYSCRFYLWVGYSGFVDGKWTEFRWYPKGYFIINQRATSYNAATDTMNLSLSDLYCTLNGDRGGSIKASELEIQAVKGTNMSELIFNTAGMFGGIREFDIDMIGSEYENSKGEMQNEVTGIGYNQLPYDLNYTQSQTVSEIITAVRDIRSGWEACFDKYGKFKVKRIPSYINEAPSFKFSKDILIKEDCTLSNNEIRNEVVVYGKTFSPSLSIGRDKYKILNTTLISKLKTSSGYLIMDLKINDVKRRTTTNNNYHYDINLAFAYGKVSSSDNTELTWYPVHGTASFEVDTRDRNKYYLALDADTTTIDTEGVCQPLISCKKSNYQGSLKDPKVFAYYQDGIIALVKGSAEIGYSPWTDSGFNDSEGSSPPYRYYSMKGFTKENILGVGSNDNGLLSVGEMVGLDLPTQYLPVEMKFPQNNPYIVKGELTEGDDNEVQLIYLSDLSYENGNDAPDSGYLVFNRNDIFDNRSEYDGLFGSYIYRVSKVEYESGGGVKKVHLEYVCPSECPVATRQDLNPNSPFNIYENQIFATVLSGGVYDNIYTTREAEERAQYEIWKSTQLKNEIEISTLDVPWLDENTKVEYTPLSSGVSGDSNQYIVQKINNDLASGTMTVNMTLFYPTYPELSYTNK